MAYRLDATAGSGNIQRVLFLGVNRGKKFSLHDGFDYCQSGPRRRPGFVKENDMSCRVATVFLQVCLFGVLAFSLCGQTTSAKDNDEEYQEYEKRGWHLYKLTIDIKAEIPTNADIFCAIEQIEPEAYNLPGKPSFRILQSGEVSLELWHNPKLDSRDVFQIVISNSNVAKDTGCDLWLYHSEPFKLDTFGDNRQRKFIVDELQHHKSLGIQRYQVTDLKGEKYPKLPVYIAMKDVKSANPAPFNCTFKAITDADGAFSVRLFSGIGFTINADYRDCLISRPNVTDGTNDYSFSTPRQMLPTTFMIQLAKGLGESLKTAGIQKVTAKFSPWIMAKVYEIVDGKEQPTKKIKTIIYTIKNNRDLIGFGYALSVSGRFMVLAEDALLSDSDGGIVEFSFQDEYKHLENDYKIEPATFNFSSWANDDKIHEIKYVLTPKSSAKFTASDSVTGKLIAEARLYLLAPHNNRSATEHRPGEQIPAAPGELHGVLFAPGYEIAEVDLSIPKEAINQPFAWKLRPAPEVKIDFAAEGVTEDGKAQLKVGYAQYPFIPPQSFPFDYRRGQGSVTARLDLKRPMTMVVNDLRREMLFPGAVVRHPGGKAPAAIAVKAPAPYVYSGKLKEGVVAETKRPALVFWLPEIPGANAAPIGYASVSTDGALAARLAPGVKYRRFLRCPSPDPADKDKSPREADKYYLLEPFVTPEKGAQAEPETIAPGREITRKEAYALIEGWVF